MGCGQTKSTSRYTAARTPKRSSVEKDGGIPGAAPASNGDKQRLLDFYTVGQQLGQGTFGVVYACKPRGEESKECAVKMVDKVETPEEKIAEEARFLQRMDHPNVMKCFDVIYDKCFVCIVMERLKGGDLISGMQRHWKAKGKIPLASTIFITSQMTASISYLHRQDLVHRDIKGDNYLCDRPDVDDREIRVVLTDFGTVAECTPETRLTDKCGTKLYWSPEFYSKNYSQKVDVWAMGVVCYGLINGRFPFRDEQEVRNKVIKLPESASQTTKDFVNGLLCKVEENRFSSDLVASHVWMQSEANEEAISNSSQLRRNSLDEEEFIREGVADAGVQDRRAELLERIQDVHEKMSSGRSKSERISVQEQPYWKDVFHIKHRHLENMVCKYEWWSMEKAAKAIDGLNDGKVNGQAPDYLSDTGSTEVVGKMLQEHGIAVDRFGRGEAKTLVQLAAEVQSGAAVLMLDASKHKKLVRVVNVVLLRISSGGSKPKFLVETGEKFADGRKRSTHRLPGTKKEPHENSKQTAERMMRDHLNIPRGQVRVQLLGKEVFEEEDESPSYPGVRTVYNKVILSATCEDESFAMNPSGKSVGGQKTDSSRSSTKSENAWKNKSWEFKDKSGNTKYFAWITEQECRKKKIKFEAPEEGNAVSALVHAPLGMEVEELTKYFKAHKADLSSFGKDGAKSIKDIAAELARGECQLVPSSNGGLTRIIDVVLIKLTSVKGLLVETEQAHANGKIIALKRLPGAKRRPDENQFITAKRILTKFLKVHETHVVLNANSVQFQEEEKLSPSYPGLRTTYRKRILTAELQKNVAKEIL